MSRGLMIALLVLILASPVSTSCVAGRDKVGTTDEASRAGIGTVPFESSAIVFSKDVPTEVKNAATSTLGDRVQICDGIDDEIEIQAAIDALAEVGGGKVILSEGEFRLSAHINVESHITLSGMGKATCLTSTVRKAGIRGTGTAASPLTDIVVENLFMRGPKLTPGSDADESGMRFRYCDGLIIRGCYVEQYTYDAILLHEGCNNAIVHGNIVRGSGDDGINVLTAGGVGITVANNICEGMANDGIHWSGGEGVISNNVSRNNGGSGILLNAYGSDSKIVVEGNSLDNNAKAGIYVGLLEQPYDLSAVITGNIISNGGECAGIEADVQADAGLIQDLLIADNLIQNVNSRGIYLHAAANGDILRASIVGNIVSNTGAQAIEINYIDDCICTDNMLAGSYADILVNNCLRSSVKDNHAGNIP